MNIPRIVAASEALRKKVHQVITHWRFDDRMVGFQIAVYVCAILKINGRCTSLEYNRICSEMVHGTKVKIGDLVPISVDLSLLNFKLIGVMPPFPKGNRDMTEWIAESEKAVKQFSIPLVHLHNLMIECRIDSMKKWAVEDPIMGIAQFLGFLAEPLATCFSNNPEVRIDFEMAGLNLFGVFTEMHSVLADEIKRSR